MLIKFSPSLLLENAVCIIRDKNTDSAKFRKYIERIGSYLSYEASKIFESETISVETPLAMAESRKIKNDITILSILRAALPMTNSVFNQFEGASLGIISASRGNMIKADGKEFAIESNYSKIPDIENEIVIIVDPMIIFVNTFSNFKENDYFTFSNPISDVAITFPFMFIHNKGSVEIGSIPLERCFLLLLTLLESTKSGLP